VTQWSSHGADLRIRDITDRAAISLLGMAATARWKTGADISMVAENVEARTLASCGHFMPEERPEFVIGKILGPCARIADTAGRSEMQV